MCGRFTQQRPTAELAELFDAEPAPAELEPRYNLAPTDEAAVVVERADRRAIRAYRWGLIPSWAKDERIASKLFNARAETLDTSGAFRDSFRNGAASCPPMRSTSGAGATASASRSWSIGSMAHRWPWPACGPAGTIPRPTRSIRTFTIITTSANEALSSVHDRMPVILEPRDWKRWLDTSNTDLGDAPSHGSVIFAKAS